MTKAEAVAVLADVLHDQGYYVWVTPHDRTDDVPDVIGLKHWQVVCGSFVAKPDGLYFCLEHGAISSVRRSLYKVKDAAVPSV